MTEIMIFKMVKITAMKKFYTFTYFVFFCFSNNLNAQDVNFLWAKQLGGVNDDSGHSIAVDANGNIYLTGQFIGTADFDPGLGTHNLTSYGFEDSYVSKLDATGNFLWAKQFGGVNGAEGNSIAVDASGNVYTTGFFTGTADFDPGVGTYNLTAGFVGIYVSKLDSSGNFLWAKKLAGGSGLQGRGNSVALDANGNVYTTGYFLGTDDFDPGMGNYNLTSNGSSDIYVSKLDAFGNFVWASQLGGANDDYGKSITFDTNGNVYVTGVFKGTADFDPGIGTYTLNSAGGSDIFISKLDGFGNFLWAKQMGGPNEDSSSSIIIDTNGDIYSTGYFEGIADFDPNSGTYNLTSEGASDIFVYKLDASGNFVWAKQLGGPTIFSEGGNSIAVDSNDNIYITGYFSGTADFDPNSGVFNLTSGFGDQYGFVSKLDNSGNFVWAKQLNGTAVSGISIIIDVNENIYTTGVFQSITDFDSGTGTYYLTSAGIYDAFVLKLGQGGGSGSTIGLTGDLSFGNIPINQTSQLTYSITNLGSSDLTVSSITYPTGFTGNWSGGIITAGNSQPVAVTFAPTLAQSYSGVVTVISDANSGDNTLPISGTGTSIQNTGLSVSGNLDFGTVQVGSFDDMPVLLHNNTTSIITIESITFSPTGVFNALMQNGNTILPGQSLPVSIFFFPPGLATYSTTFTIISNAPNGIVTFTATGTGGDGIVSWIGVYNMPENNPEITTQKPLEEHYITENTGTPVKICADGSKATIVKFINNDGGINISDITFNMKSDPFGNNTDYTGWFTTPYSYEGDSVVVAKFTHPKYLNVSGLYRKDTIQVRNASNGSIIHEIPARIYRAPVILVHGLWGDMTSMLTIFGELLSAGKYNSSLARVTDYSSTSANSFLANSNVIKNEINSTLLGLRLSNYSAGKIDIVAHSMGGVLSRIYLQSNDCGSGPQTNCYRGDIHKLITLNTPHSGSQLPNFVLSDAGGAGLARDILDYNGMYWNSGAVANLRCNSQEIGWLNGASLNNHIVPCFAIQTESSVGLSNALNENALTNIISAARNQSGQDFNNEVFAFSPNDLIVPTNSQRGGLIDFDFIQGTLHTNSPDDAAVINVVKILLDENPAASLYFDQNGGGYDPPVIPPTFFIQEPEPCQNKALNIGTVTITNPILGFTCSEGDIVQIDVTSSENINRLIVTASNKNTGITSFDTLASSATFYYTVPNNIAGPVKIMAIGYDSTGFVDLDTLEITANPMATLDSLGFVNDNIYIPVGQSIPFTLFGYFHDATIRNLSEVSNIPYDLADSNIASLTSNQSLKGISIGTTYLHANYQGKDAYVSVHVYEGDNWTFNPCPADSIVNESAVLNVNNVKATLNSNGAMFWDFNEGQFIAPYQPGQPEISALRVVGTWLGGFDPGSNLKGAIQLYNENCKSDFAPGVLSSDGGIPTGQLQGIYKVTANDIQQHLGDFADNGVINNPNPNVFGWPARGNAFFSQYHIGETLPDTDQGLADFWDENGNNYYNPNEGDYPMLRVRNCNQKSLIPDEMLWFVFNDNKLHSESSMTPIKIEIQCHAFAFDNETPMENAVFVKYKIINRELEDIDSTYFGIFADFDIGNPSDDYFGCDTAKNIMFGYNGDDDDEFGYGTNAPAMAIDLIRGPLDGNGQELGLEHVMQVEFDLPLTDLNYYRLLTGTDVFGLPTPNNGIYYMGNPNVPNSDSEITAGNPPGERRTLVSYGPLTLQPGATNDLIVAFTYYQEPGNTPLQNVEAMYNQADALQMMFDTCFNTLTGVVENSNPKSISWNIYPNPSTGYFTISLKSDEFQNVEILCTNLLGQSIFSKEYSLNNGELKTELDISTAGKGVYLVQIRSNGKSTFRKVAVVE